MRLVSHNDVRTVIFIHLQVWELFYVAGEPADIAAANGAFSLVFFELVVSLLKQILDILLMFARIVEVNDCILILVHQLLWLSLSYEVNDLCCSQGGTEDCYALE